MGLGEGFGDRKSQAGAPAVGPAMEQLEDALALVGRDSRARIRDGDLDVARPGPARRLHQDLGAGRAVPGGVLEQVGQGLGEQGRVHLELRQVRRHGPAQSRGVEGALDKRSGFVDEVVHHDRLAFRLERTRLEAPQLEHGADEACQAVGLLLDRLEQVTARRVGEHDRRFPEIGDGDLYRGERGAQIMRHGADECRPPLVDLLEEVGLQGLVAQPRAIDGEGSMVGVGREQAAVVDVEFPSAKDQEPDRARRGGERYLSENRAGDDAAGERCGTARGGQEAVQRLGPELTAVGGDDLELVGADRGQQDRDGFEVEGVPDARGDHGQHLVERLVSDEQLRQLEETARVGRAARRVDPQLLQARQDERDQEDDDDVDDKGQPVLGASYRQGPIRRDEGQVEHEETKNDAEQSDARAAEQHGGDDRQDEHESSCGEAQTAAERDHRCGRRSHGHAEGDDACPETAPGSLSHARPSLGPGRGQSPR